MGGSPSSMKGLTPKLWKNFLVDMSDKCEDVPKTRDAHNARDTRRACVASGEERGATERWDRREGGRERTEEREGMDTDDGAQSRA